VLAGFLALSGYAVAIHGIAGIGEVVMANAVAVTLAVDLSLALTLIMIWMWRDAGARGVSPLPYILVTLAAGSAGPLLYLIRRQGSGTAGRTTVAAPVR
jgi:hypothetical protein